MKTFPIVMRVESGGIVLMDYKDGSIKKLIDVHSQIPVFWQKIEESLRFDLSLCVRAKLLENQCDIVWAGSENIGILLSFMGFRKPIVVIAHHMSSPKKAKYAKLTGAVTKWAGIGYVSDESRDFFIEYFGVQPDRLFQYMCSRHIDLATSSEITYQGPIISTGVAKRDYNTLIAALTNLVDYETELFVSSRFGDRLNDKISLKIPPWVQLQDWVAEETLTEKYSRARFVVVPLHKTTHTGAGVNSVLEAGAFGKAVIGTNTGGMATFVKNGETGILVPPYDVEALREAILYLWSQPVLARRMGQAGRCYVEENYNECIVSEQISNFLTNLFLSQKCR